VPYDAPFGDYTGQITVSSSNAGTQVVNVSVHVELFADSDFDGDLDLYDFACFQGCFGGDGVPIVDSACAICDSDGDNDVDLADYAAFAALYGGP